MRCLPHQRPPVGHQRQRHTCRLGRPVGRRQRRAICTRQLSGPLAAGLASPTVRWRRSSTHQGCPHLHRRQPPGRPPARLREAGVRRSRARRACRREPGRHLPADPAMCRLRRTGSPAVRSPGSSRRLAGSRQVRSPGRKRPVRNPGKRLARSPGRQRRLCRRLAQPEARRTARRSR